MLFAADSDPIVRGEAAGALNGPLLGPEAVGRCLSVILLRSLCDCSFGQGGCDQGEGRAGARLVSPVFCCFTVAGLRIAVTSVACGAGQASDRQGREGGGAVPWHARAGVDRRAPGIQKGAVCWLTYSFACLLHHRPSSPFGSCWRFEPLLHWQRRSWLGCCPSFASRHARSAQLSCLLSFAFAACESAECLLSPVLTAQVHDALLVSQATLATLRAFKDGAAVRRSLDPFASRCGSRLVIGSNPVRADA